MDIELFNHVPEITVEAGDSADATLIETDSGLAASGTLTVSDLDTTDVVETSITNLVVTGNTDGLQASDEELLQMLLVNQQPIDGTSQTGEISWTFDSGSEYFDYLAAGETVTLTYTVTAEDYDAQTFGDLSVTPVESSGAFRSHGEWRNEHAFAVLREDGTVVTWGLDWAGGDSSGVAAQLTDVTAIYSTHNAFAALKSDGTVVTWGEGWSGGDSSGVAAELTDVTAIYSTEGAFAAVKSDGTVVTWGHSASGGDSSGVATDLNDVQQIFSTAYAFAALKSDGTIVSWGNDASGGDSSAVAAELTDVAWAANVFTDDVLIQPYTETIPSGDSATRQVTITIEGTNDDPVATDNFYSLAEDTVLTGNLITDDTGAGTDGDIDGENLRVGTFTVHGTTYAAGETASFAEGELMIRSDGRFTFVAAADYHGTVPTITYTIEDFDNKIQNGSLEGTPLSFDRNVHNSVVPPGWVAVDGTPDVFDETTSTFSYAWSASPDGGDFVHAFSTVTKDGLRMREEAFGQTLTGLTVGEQYTVTFFQTSSSSEFNNHPNTPSGSWRVEVAGETFHSDLMTTPGLGVVAPWEWQSFQFTATETTELVSFHATGTSEERIDFGIDGIMIFANDAVGRSASAQLDFEVTPVNDPPTDADQTIAVDEDTPVLGNLLANAHDVDGDALSVSDFTIAGEAGPFLLDDPYTIAGIGTLTISSDGSFSFDPAPDYVGPVPEISYTLSDGNGGTVTSSLTLDFLPVNDLPVAVGVIDTQAGNDADQVNFDVSGYFDDVDTGDTLTYSHGGTLPRGLSIDSVTGVISGTLDSSASADAPYQVVITATDSQGASVTQAFIWDVENWVPVAQDDLLAINGSAAATELGNVLANDVDPDGDSLSIVPRDNVAGSNGGLFSIASDGTITFDPNDDFDQVHISDSLTTAVQYTVVDADGGTAVATVYVTVIGPNNTPVARDDQFELEGSSLTANAFANDFDPDGDSLSGSVTIPPEHGTLVWQFNGTFTYTPGANFIGTDQFTYKVLDQHGAVTTAVVHINRTIATDTFNDFTAKPANLSQVIAPQPREVVFMSRQLEQVSLEPILAGYARPGTLLVGRVYAADGSVLAESTASANLAGNWVMQFSGFRSTGPVRVVIEHVITDETVFGDLIGFRLTPDSYSSFQLGVDHESGLSAGSILSDTPFVSLELWHANNKHPLRML